MPIMYNETAGMHKKGTITIGVMVARGIKSHRDKLSGILRFAAGKPNWKIVIFEETSRPSVRFDAQIILHRNALKADLANLPVVTVDQFSAASQLMPNVFIDNTLIGKTAADLFIQRGFANLAAVRQTSGGDATHSDQRIDAFVATAAKTGLPVSVYTPASASESEFLCNSSAFQKWLLDLPKPCGIFCFYDRQARDVLDSCRLALLSIPNQIAILGVDNETDVCEVTRPTISSIQPDFEAAGHCAAKVLDDMLSHRKVRKTYPYGILRLVERESTQPMNAGSRIVSAAMQLIRTTNEKPTVTGLARQLNVSTALLNLRFNEILGHGPKEEIDRQQLARIQELLRDSSRSITEVANLCHFAYPEELHLFFRRRTGLTPTQWRKYRA